MCRARRFSRYAIRRLKVKGGKYLDYVAMFPIAVPGIVFGTGIFWTYILTPVYGTIWVLVLAFVASYLPFAFRLSDTALLQIDRALEEASSLCGASHGRTAGRITLPLMRPALLSAWVMVFIFSVREISAAILLTFVGQHGAFGSVLATISTTATCPRPRSSGYCRRSFWRSASWWDGSCSASASRAQSRGATMADLSGTRSGGELWRRRRRRWRFL